MVCMTLVLALAPRGAQADSTPRALAVTGQVGGLMSAVAVAPARLLAGEGMTLVLFDTSPGAPLRRRASVALAGVVQAVAYADGWAYVATANALETVQVDSDRLRVVARLPLSGDLRGVAVAEGRVYVAAERAGFHIVDVTRPEQPTLLASSQPGGRILALAIRPPYLYLADQNVTLTVIDVSRPSNPTITDTIDDLATVTDLAVQGDRLYLATTRGLRVLSLADAAHPLDLGRYPANALYSLYSLAVAGDTVYVGHYQHGVEAFVVDAQGQPTPLCPGCPSPYPDESRANVTDLATDGMRVYVADGDALRVMAAGGPTANGTPLRILDTALGFTVPLAVSAWGDFAYVAAESQGLAVVDLRGAPQVTHRYDVETVNDPPYVRAVAATANRVYLINWGTLYRFDRGQPAQPPLLDAVTLVPYRPDFWEWPPLAAVAGDERRVVAGGLTRLFSVGVGTTDVVSATGVVTGVTSLALQGDTVYVGRAGGVSILNWPPDAAPTVVGQVAATLPGALAVQGTRLAVGRAAGVDLFSVADPAQPTLLGTYPTLGFVPRVALTDETLIVLDTGSRAVDWVDIRDSAHPTRVASTGALPQPTALALASGRLLTTDYTGGLLVWQGVTRVFLPWVRKT